MTVPDPIPERVRRFLAGHVDAAEQLEALLLLHGDPDRGWTADEVAARIYTVAASAERRLRELAARGLVAVDEGEPPRFAYAPADPHLRADVDALAQTYRVNRVAVIHQVFARPPEDPVRSFADAFKLRKDRGR